MGGTEKGGGDTKLLKRGQPGLRDGCLKKGGLKPPYKLGEGWRVDKGRGFE